MNNVIPGAQVYLRASVLAALISAVGAVLANNWERVFPRDPSPIDVIGTRPKSTLLPIPAASSILENGSDSKRM